MSADLVTWLRAIWDEDERVAQAASPDPWQAWHAMTDGDVPVKVAEQPAGSPPMILCKWQSDATHIARHDPARVLREVEAKRRILDLHAPVLVNFGDETACTECARAPINGRCMTLRLLALPCADRPGYDEAWRP